MRNLDDLKEQFQKDVMTWHSGLKRINEFKKRLDTEGKA